VGGGERHRGGVDVGQGAALERLDDLAAAVEHHGLDAPGHDRADQGAAVAAVADV
jgi:hypothetical protein